MRMKWPALVAAVVGLGAFPASGEGLRSLSQAAGYVYGGVVLSVDWFGPYVAVGGYTGGGGQELRVLRLEAGALTEIAAADFDALVYSLAWHPSGAYLAVGGDSSLYAEVRTFAFDGASLVELAGGSVDTSSEVHSVDWSPDGNHLALAEINGGDGAELRVLAFDGATLTAIPTATFDHGNLLFAVDWSPSGTFLGVAGENGTGGFEVRVLSFDGTAVVPVAGFDQIGGVLVLDWNQSGSLLGFNGPGSDLRIVSFDGSTLTHEASFDHGAPVVTFRWRPGSEFFAISGAPGTGGDEIRVLEFDPDLSTITEIDVASHGTTVNDVAWSDDGMYLGSGSYPIATGVPEVRVWDTSSVPVELSRFVVE